MLLPEHTGGQKQAKDRARDKSAHTLIGCKKLSCSGTGRKAAKSRTRTFEHESEFLRRSASTARLILTSIFALETRSAEGRCLSSGKIWRAASFFLGARPRASRNSFPTEVAGKVFNSRSQNEALKEESRKSILLNSLREESEDLWSSAAAPFGIRTTRCGHIEKNSSTFCVFLLTGIFRPPILQLQIRGNVEAPGRTQSRLMKVRSNPRNRPGFFAKHSSAK